MKEIILSTLSVAGELRPNKLRKIVCRKVEGATWTQFATCLEALLQERKVRKMVVTGGESFISLAVGSSSSGGSPTDTKNDGNDNAQVNKAAIEDANSSNVRKEEMSVPRAVGLYLHKASHKKLKNIEMNTKTKITIYGQLLLGTKHTPESLKEMHTVEITTTLSGDSEEEKALAEKHLKAAKNLLTKTVTAYKRNPDRFVPNFGGTLEEQAAREDAIRLVIEKRYKKQQNRQRNGGNTKQQRDRAKPKDESSSKSNKRTKFY